MKRGTMSGWVRVVCAGLALGFAAGAARGEEGMWLVNSPPRDLLKSAYGFEPSASWLEAMQKSAVNFGGASGSFVSADGLVMTNHHVASDTLAKLSTKERDILTDGYLAESREQELRAPDLELLVLESIEDVTARVQGAAGAGASSAEAAAARRKMMSMIEEESQQATGLLSRVVTLYQGGRYHLYRYTRYNDVRLVFAPEKQLGFFGGDTDNFEYPRYCLDVAFFRVYVDGKPVRPAHYLKWSEAGAKEGETVFVFGHPGRTRRLFTMDHLKFLRDVETPARLAALWRSEVQWQNFMSRSDENHRIAADDLFGVQNGRKFLTGSLQGMLDPALMARKQAAEERLKSFVAGNAEHQKNWGGAWEQIALAQREHAEFFHRRAAVQRVVSGSAVGSAALTIVQLVDELAKPSAERLREYRDTNLESVYQDLYSTAPLYEHYEVFRMWSVLSNLAERLGGDDALVVKVLAGKSPRQRAEELVRGSKLFRVDERRKLVEGGKSAIEASTDPLIGLARLIDPELRALRARFEDRVEAVERAAYAQVASAKFAMLGESVYPDATGTLRMSFGRVKGYEEDGRQVPAFTTFAGLYERWAERRGEGAFSLPQQWIDRREQINASTPFNFVFTSDIVGGNSGSPVVNTAGEVVGLVFDGNIHFLTADVMYDDRQGRAVAVDSRSIPEALRVMYGAEELARELMGR